MNEIINKFLLTGDKFIPEMHLRQPVFTYSACGPFTKHKERIRKFSQTGDTRCIYRNELDKACFQHDSAYTDNKDLINRTKADKVLKDKAYDIASNPEYDGYQRGLASIMYTFLIKRLWEVVLIIVLKLADELHKSIIRKFNKRKVYPSFKDNIWDVDLAEMQLLSRFNKGLKYLLCVIDLFSKYAFVVLLKDKKGWSIVNAFQSILDKSRRKPNKIWVDQGSEFYNDVFKMWLKNNDISMYSTYNEGKSVVAERFIRTLKNKLYKHMTAVPKNVFYDVLDDIVKKYNNTWHSTFKMKPKDVGDDNFTKYAEQFNEKDPKFNVGDRVRISKYKSVFAKGYMPNWSEEVFIVSMVKNTVPWTYEINDLNGEKTAGSFYEKELQKTDQKEFRIEKVIRRKGDKLYIKWKGYDDSFNSWINKSALTE